MKAESRGKYAGVKLHLEPEECELLIAVSKTMTVADFNSQLAAAVPLIAEMCKQVRKLSIKLPKLLEERSTEEIAAIMAKEIEKQKLQLAQLKAGADWKTVDQDKLQAALLAHVKKGE